MLFRVFQTPGNDERHFYPRVQEPAAIRLRLRVFQTPISLAFKKILLSPSIDTVEILEQTEKKPSKIMFHCFDLNEQTARFIIKNGYKISVGGNITYKRTETAINVLKDMPLESIMTETDAPYLAPQSKRGTRNDSSNIHEVIEKLADGVQGRSCIQRSVSPGERARSPGQRLSV